MNALPIQATADHLRSTGLTLSLTAEGGLRVTPASIITPALRDLIRTSKAALMDYLIRSVEIRVRAQRRAGEMLSVMPKQTVGDAAKARSGAATELLPLSLADMGITKDQSANWQSLASMSEEHFEATVEAAKDVPDPFVEPNGYQGTGWRLAGADGLSMATLAKFRAASLALDANQSANHLLLQGAQT